MIGRNTISTISLDPLCWHFCLLLIPSVIGIWFCSWLGGKTGVYLPEYAIGFVAALLFAFILNRIGVSEYIDYRITDRIAGTCTDFIVFLV